MQTEHRTVRRDLEGLRGVAVIGVVVYHLRHSWLPGGLAGVDVFFVLSGFFITGLLLREAQRTGRIDLAAFYARRARRLLPLAAVVMIGTVLASYVFVDAIDAKRFAVDGIYVSVFSVNWHYAQLGTDYGADNSSSPMQHFWSLGVEEQFYLVWPVILLGLVLLLARRRKPGRHGSDRPQPQALVAAVVTAACAVSFYLAYEQTHGNQPYAFFATYSRVWQLGIGALIAVCAVGIGKVLPLALRAPVRWGGLAAIVGFYALAPANVADIYPGLRALIPTLGTAAVVIAGLPRGEEPAAVPRWDPVGRVMSSRLGLWLGRYSYGWYLWHWPPIVLVPLALGHGISTRSSLGIGVLSLAAAVVSYHLLENPVRSNRTLTAHRGRWSLALGAVLILAGAGTAQAMSSVAQYKATHTTITAANGKTLTPNPGLEAPRFSQPKKDDCELAQQSHDLAHECRYRADKGHGDVVLVGDSHGAQWYPAVNEVAKENDWGLRVWTRQSCPFADVTKLYGGAPNQYCNKWRADVTARLLKDRPSLVILANLATNITQEVDPTTGNTVTGKAAKTLWIAGMVKQLKILKAAHIPVLLIRDNPGFTFYGPKCALENPDHLDKCSLPRAEALGEPVDLEAVKKVGGIAVLDVTNTFCDTSRCYQIIGSTLAYHDYNHLTDVMDLKLAPQLKVAAAKALQEK